MRLSELCQTFKFVKAANLQRNGSTYKIDFIEDAMRVLDKDVVYLITRNETIFYIGQTRRGFKKRVTSYADERRTRLRYVHREMRNQPASHCTFEIWAYSPSPIQFRNGFVMRPLADFERMLVEKVGPIWNRDLMNGNQQAAEAIVQTKL